MEEFFSEAAHNNRRISFQDLQAILDAMPVALSWAYFPGGHIQACNKAFVQLFGYRAEQFATVDDWLNTVYETDEERRQIVAYRGQFFRDIKTDAMTIGPKECRVRCADGSFRYTLNKETVLPALGIGITTFEDITDRKLAEDVIRRASLEDPLTGVGNRRALHAQWTLELSKRDKADRPIMAILLADLNDFKQVNDRLGHAIGDFVLQEISGRLKKAVRDIDFIFRTGGDEFTLILPDLNEMAEIELICQQIRHEICLPIQHGSHVIEVGVCIGISLYSDDSGDLPTLLSQADEALYRAKRSGKNGWNWYSA